MAWRYNIEIGVYSYYLHSWQVTLIDPSSSSEELDEDVDLRTNVTL